VLPTGQLLIQHRHKRRRRRGHRPPNPPPTEPSTSTRPRDAPPDIAAPLPGTALRQESSTAARCFDLGEAAAQRGEGVERDQRRPRPGPSPP
jgi:hypothetical protein